MFLKTSAVSYGKQNGGANNFDSSHLNMIGSNNKKLSSIQPILIFYASYEFKPIDIFWKSNQDGNLRFCFYIAHSSNLKLIIQTSAVYIQIMNARTQKELQLEFERFCQTQSSTRWKKNYSNSWPLESWNLHSKE